MSEKINLNLSNIKNLIVRRALQLRRGDFMFNYGDGDSYSDTVHTDKSHRRYNDAWKKYSDHTEHTESPPHSDYNVYSDSDFHKYWERSN
ncbi:MAG: hypothetical protein AABX29_10120 [Nanoarchaeota archaeon]